MNNRISGYSFTAQVSTYLKADHISYTLWEWGISGVNIWTVYVMFACVYYACMYVHLYYACISALLVLCLSGNSQ